jgi:hypothetical protein
LSIALRGIPEQDVGNFQGARKFSSLDNKREILYTKTSAVSGKFFES